MVAVPEKLDGSESFRIVSMAARCKVRKPLGDRQWSSGSACPLRILARAIHE